MRFILIRVAFTFMCVDMVQSLVHIWAYSVCAKPTFFHDCSQVQPWVIKIAEFIFGVKIVLAAMALLGFLLTVGGLIVPWIVAELVVLTQKVVNAVYYAHFYPILTITTEFKPSRFSAVYMQTLLEIAIELMGWYLICHAHEFLHRKSYVKKKSNDRKIVVQRDNRGIKPRDAY